MESVSERRDQPSKSFDIDRRNKIKTEICPLDLTVWRSLVIFISVVLVTVGGRPEWSGLKRERPVSGNLSINNSLEEF